MKKNKILTIKTILSLAAATLLVLSFPGVFLACSNIGDDLSREAAVQEDDNQEGTGTASGQSGTDEIDGQNDAQDPVLVTVSGSLDIGGAYPEEIAALVDGGHDGVERSAFPGIPSGLTYTVYAEEDTTEATKLRYEGTVAADGKSYTVGIPVTSGKKYYVYANAANSDGLVILSGKSAVLDFNTITSFTTDANITLSATQTDTGTGCVSLTIADPDQKVVSACVCYKIDSTNYEKNLTKSGSGANTVWTLVIGEIKTDAGTGQKYIENGLKAGARIMTFEFYSEVDCSGTLLYSFTEAVNVFDNMSTNKWVQNGAESWFVTTTSAGVKNTTCQITAAMVQGFGLTEIYVDPTVANDVGTGSYFNPKKTFASAVAMLHDGSAHYTIYIKGTVQETSSINNQMAHYIPDTISAKSLTLCGVNAPDANGVPQDALDGGGARGTLYIASAVPITIKNLKISGGKAPLGGGISTDTNDFTLTLADGAYISGNEATNENYGGGGVFFSGAELIMLDGAVIEGNNASGSGTSKANGGGVYLNTGKKFTMKGGVIKGNNAVGNGGGVYMTQGTFTMTGGVIGDDTKDTPANSNSGKYSNKASKGAGVYVYGVKNYESQTKTDLLGGTIAYNYATVNGGGVYAALCNAVTIKNTVKCNGAVCGGGVYTFSSNGCDTYVNLDGCSILKNKAYPTDITKEGGGALVVGNSSTQVTCSVKLKGDVSIPCTGKYENDIQLGTTASNTAVLSIGGKLTQSGVIGTITPLSYSEDHIVIDCYTSGTKLVDEITKFAITPQSSPAQNWTITADGSDGRLAKATAITSDNIASFTVADFTEGAKVVYVFDENVTNDQIEVFTEKLYHNATGYNPDQKKVGEGSVLDFSKATKLTKIGFSNWSNYGVMQPFDIILPPKAASNLFGSMTFVWAIQNAQNVIAPPDCINFTSENGIVYSKNKKMLCLYPGGRSGASWTVPSDVTEIGYYAFAYGNNLKNVSLPSQLTKIGQSAFYSSKIESLTIPANVTQIDYRAFGYGMSSLTSLVFSNPNGWHTKDNNGNILMDLDANKLDVAGDVNTEGSTLWYFTNTVNYNWNKLVRD